MKLMIVDTITQGRVEVATPDADVLVMAAVLEQSSAVNSFFVSGLTMRNQQAAYGVSGYKKWITAIPQ